VHPVEPSGLTDANEARLQYFLSNVPTVKRIIVCLVGEAQFRMQILHQSITIKLARRPNPQITSSTCKTWSVRFKVNVINIYGGGAAITDKDENKSFWFGLPVRF
jgi:hypothetical protein